MKSTNSLSDKLRLIILLICLLAVKINFAQNKKEIIAKAGNITITKDEFKKRFEFAPHPRTDGRTDTTFLKMEFLQTLIAEKLLFQQAIKERLDLSSEFLKAYKFIRNNYLRDALYTEEVKNKTVIPDSEIVKGENKFVKKVFSKFIFSNDEKEITTIYNNLLKGASFDSILSTRPEKNEQKNAEEITFGKMNEKMENVLFQTKVGDVTPPIELKEGWYICKVYSITNTNNLEPVDLKKIERVVRDRLYDRTYQEFYRKFFKGIVINSDRQLFNKIFKSVNGYISANKPRMIKKNGKYALYEKDIDSIRNKFTPKELESDYIKFTQQPVKVKEFLDFMRNEGFEFVSFDSVKVKSRLNTYIATFIQNEILAREALKRGYEKLPEIDFDLKIWREYFLANLMMKKLYKTESVSDDEAYKFFAKNNKIIVKPEEFKISQIIADNLETVQKIFSELEAGKDFAQLTRIYNSENHNKKQNSEIDSDEIDTKSEIWEVAKRLKIGEVYGPIKVPDGFAIIKLLERKEQKKEQVESFEEAKNDIKDYLQSEKMINKLEDVTAKLALDNKMEINEKVLNSIKLNPVNMVVFKRFGFGGQQIAVPYTPNFSSWMKKYEILKKSLSF